MSYSWNCTDLPIYPYNKWCHFQYRYRYWVLVSLDAKVLGIRCSAWYRSNLTPQTVVCPVLGMITEKSIGPIPIPPNTGKYWPIYPIPQYRYRSNPRTISNWACDDELRSTLVTVPSNQLTMTAWISALPPTFCNFPWGPIKFQVFPGGISNSSRFPVFPEAVDTLKLKLMC